MAYIGRGLDKISNVEKLDNLTFDGSSSYTLQKGGSNFTPSSANNILLSIDGVIQAGNFTVSGSTIDFGTAVSGSSTCDFILHYGVGVITTPSDGSVTTAKLGDSAVTTAKLNDGSVSLAKLTATGTKDATTFLRGDNTFASAGESNKPLFVAQLSAAQGSAAFTVSKLNLSNEIIDTDNCYDPSTNYRFTPTTAGKYFLYLKFGYESDYDHRTARIMIYKNGSNIAEKRFSLSADYMDNFSSPLSFDVSTITEANGTSDYFEAYFLTDQTGAIQANTNWTQFGGYLIST